jgi:hypothetical protein
LIEIIYLLGGVTVLIASFFVYIDLVGKGKIKPHIPPRYMSRKTTHEESFGMQRLRSFTSGIR